MKKKLLLLCSAATVLIGGCCALSGFGNRAAWDTTYTFDRAIIKLQNGEVIEGKVQKWQDYENSDQLQVKIDGKTYLVHSMNITLIAE